mgnify:CR=1 FL=1
MKKLIFKRNTKLQCLWVKIADYLEIEFRASHFHTPGKWVVFEWRMFLEQVYGIEIMVGEDASEWVTMSMDEDDVLLLLLRSQ